MNVSRPLQIERLWLDFFQKLLCEMVPSPTGRKAVDSTGRSLSDDVTLLLFIFIYFHYGLEDQPFKTIRLRVSSFTDYILEMVETIALYN